MDRTPADLHRIGRLLAGVAFAGGAAVAGCGGGTTGADSDAPASATAAATATVAATEVPTASSGAVAAAPPAAADTALPREGSPYDVDGAITNLEGAMRFQVNGVAVDASGAALSRSLDVGMRVQVQGTMRDGTLRATHVDIR
jgi:hypothetical protein